MRGDADDEVGARIVAGGVVIPDPGAAARSLRVVLIPVGEADDSGRAALEQVAEVDLNDLTAFDRARIADLGSVLIRAEPVHLVAEVALVLAAASLEHRVVPLPLGVVVRDPAVVAGVTLDAVVPGRAAAVVLVL